MRKFADDYLPNKPIPGEEHGDLRGTIEGDPITADLLAGRRRVGEGDEAITPEGTALFTSHAGATIENVPRRRIGNDAGRVINPASKNPGIRIDKSLKMESAIMCDA
jgi:hypothetical protein